MSTISLCSFEMSTTDADKGIADDKKMDKATSTGRKIVVAMDGSEHALYALDWYKENAHRPTDYVYLVYSTELQHVLHNHKWVYSPQHNNMDTVGPLIKEEQAIVRNKLEKFEIRLKNLGIQGEVKPVHAKNPGEGVVHACADLGYKDNVHRPSDHVILVYTVELGTKLETTNWVYHADENKMTAELNKTMSAERKILKDKLEIFARMLLDSKISGEVKAVHAKNPGEGVISAAKDAGAVMIVTGSRGLGALRRTILGSVSDYILHHSNIPVAICHQKV